jgi:hypothetical protein
MLVAAGMFWTSEWRRFSIKKSLIVLEIQLDWIVRFRDARDLVRQVVSVNRGNHRASISVKNVMIGK